MADRSKDSLQECWTCELVTLSILCRIELWDSVQETVKSNEQLFPDVSQHHVQEDNSRQTNRTRYITWPFCTDWNVLNKNKHIDNLGLQSFDFQVIKLTRANNTLLSDDQLATPHNRQLFSPSFEGLLVQRRKDLLS